MIRVVAEIDSWRMEHGVMVNAYVVGINGQRYGYTQMLDYQMLMHHGIFDHVWGRMGERIKAEMEKDERALPAVPEDS